MADSENLVVESDNLVKVHGRLDVTTVARYKDEGVTLIDQMDSPVFDLGDVEVSGSAAIALLIAWQRHATGKGKEIHFAHPPANLLDIAGACGVDDIVAFVSEP